MKKKIILPILIFILVSIIVLIFLRFKFLDRFRLLKIGYSIKEQTIILEKVDNLNIVFKNKYIDKLDDILISKDYRSENLEKYIKYSKNNDIDTNKIIFMVNKGISSKYNEALYKVITCENYNKDNLDLYIKYIENYVNTDDVICSSIIKLSENGIQMKYDETLGNISKEKYYIPKNTERYINYYKNNNNLKYSEVVANVNANIDNEFYTNIKDTNLSYGNLMIVNKYNKLSPTYKNNMVSIGEYGVVGYYMETTAFEAYKKMYDDMVKEGLNLKIKSAYRSYYDQQYIYNDYVRVDGQSAADTYSARPGHSEHQTGLAIDVTSTGDLWGDFSKSKEFEWMKENSYKYGFILRYPQDKEYITGYIYEPWHYRYVGIDIATYIYENNITYDEYYAYFIEKD